jgi:four helix bundle protein
LEPEIRSYHLTISGEEVNSEFRIQESGFRSTTVEARKRASPHRRQSSRFRREVRSVCGKVDYIQHFIDMFQKETDLQLMLNPAKTFKELIVWQKAHGFVLAAYALTANFPRCEIYCLTSQIRRAAISIPANIAEGFTRRGDPDKIRFLNVSRGSLEECRYYMILVQDLGYGATTDLEALLEEVSKLLVAYARAIESDRDSRLLNSEF